ncbi:cytidine deaminase [Ilumatobacter nonamiensis]|uniref:cytidine deaminase n=1 Tax=Ilumatobacter nonamiensis TaxID=467093 RepID=UPI000348FF3C|nr:cytidine deaminase [Ilumatobacter nonamiensis]
MSEHVPPPTTIAASSAVVVELFEAAVRVRERSYSPYSSYRVGAAIRTTTGDVFACCNVENAAYPEGVCAEGGAISMMVVGSDGHPTITDVVTVTGGDEPGTPCGGCRQKIREFATPDTVVHASTADGRVISMPLVDLLPISFGPDHLT